MALFDDKKKKKKKNYCDLDVVVSAKSGNKTEEALERVISITMNNNPTLLSNQSNPTLLSNQSSNPNQSNSSEMRRKSIKLLTGRDRGDIGNKPHLFKLTYFKSFTWCNFCSGFWKKKKFFFCFFFFLFFVFVFCLFCLFFVLFFFCL